MTTQDERVALIISWDNLVRETVRRRQLANESEFEAARVGRQVLDELVPKGAQIGHQYWFAVGDAFLEIEILGTIAIGASADTPATPYPVMKWRDGKRPTVESL